MKKIVRVLCFWMALVLILVAYLPITESISVPTVTTNNATGVMETNGTLRGTLSNDGGEECTVGFSYGTTTGYGTNWTYDDQYIYAGGQTTQRIYQYWRGNLTKKANTTNYGGTISVIIQDGTYVYGAGGTTNKVFQYWKSNLTKKAETASYGGQITCLGQDMTYIYADGITTRKVYQYWKSNMTKKAESASAGFSVSSLAEDELYVYVATSNNQKIFKYWKSNLTKKSESLAYGGVLQTIVEDGDYIYGGGSTVFKVFKYWKSNLTKKSETVSYGNTIYAIAVDDYYIYAGGTVNTICKYWKSNMTKITESASYGGEVRDIMVDSMYLYACGVTTQKVYKYWKSNLTKITESAGYGGNMYSLSTFDGVYTGMTFSYNAMGLSPGMLYHFRAFANNSVGTGVGSDKAFMTRPLAPTSFTATAYNRTRIDLAWTKGTGAEYTYIMAKLGSYPTNRTDGTNIYNSTGTSFSHTGLLPNQHWYYRAWAWSIDSGYGAWNESYVQADATTYTNLPPVFGIPSPANGSTGLLLSLTWQINISDPDGDLFNWRINCSNGQTNYSNGALNGTKSIALSGLTLSTTYTVWVNATDGFNWTREWFTFTTRGNLPPVFGTPSPLNGTNNANTSFTWSIPISDPNGDLFNWTIQCSNGQTNYGNGSSNGTKTLNLTGLTYLKVYWVYVNATDGYAWTRRWYIFQVMPKPNRPPIIFNEYPVNHSTVSPLQLIWNCTIQDPDGDDFDWWINVSTGDNNSQDDVNGSKFVLIFLTNFSQSYIVWVNATDGISWTRHVYYVNTSGIPSTVEVLPVGVSPVTWLMPVLVIATLCGSGSLLVIGRRRRRKI